MTPLKKSIWVDAPVETVFPYFVEAEKMIQWSGIEARLEPTPGGIFELNMGEAGLIQGRFVRVDSPAFLSYEIDAPEGMDGPKSLVEISLQVQAGGTLVEILQTGLPDPFPIIAGRGWEHHLARLSVAANGGTPGPDSLCTKPMQSLID